jgi:glyoxylase-like metal-dependent hydrolase (beta-lactamase superfamily II)
MTKNRPTCIVPLLLALTACDTTEPATPDGGVAVDAAAPDTPAPLPETARGVPIDPAIGWARKEIAPGLHWVTNGSEQAVFLVTATEVLLLDAPPSMTDAIQAALDEVTSVPVKTIVYSHYHADHIGGAGRWAQGATIVAHEATTAILTERADPARPLPTQSFTDELVLDVGGVEVRLAYPGPNHAPGNLFAYFPAQRALVAIDLVWPGWVPFYALGQATDVPGYRAAVAALLDYDFDVFVGGHVGRTGAREDIETTVAYLDEIWTEAAGALAAISIYQVAEEYGYENPYLLIDVWLDRMSKRCATAITDRWVSRLGGADIWPESHCLAAIQSLRID